jgi:hypothetical protein
LAEEEDPPTQVQQEEEEEENEEHPLTQLLPSPEHLVSLFRR